MAPADRDTSEAAFSLIVWPISFAILLRCLYALFFLKGSGMSDGEGRRSIVVSLRIVSIFALVSTFSFMAFMAQEDYRQSRHRSFYDWFMGSSSHRRTSLFFQAYLDVTDSIEAWLWSSQLFVFVVPLVLLLYRFRVECESPTLYLWLSFIFAISFGYPLFLAAVLSRYHHLAKPRTDGIQEQIPLNLVASLALCFSMLCWFPHVRGTQFEYLLIASHVILLVAVYYNCSSSTASFSVSYKSAFALVAIACSALHAHTLHRFYTTPGATLEHAVELCLPDFVTGSNHGQVSVCLDLLFTNVGTMMMLFEFNYTCLAMFTPIITPAVALSLYSLMQAN